MSDSFILNQVMFGVERAKEEWKGRDRTAYVSAYPGLNCSWKEFNHPSLLQRGELIALQ